MSFIVKCSWLPYVRLPGASSSPVCLDLWRTALMQVWALLNILKKEKKCSYKGAVSYCGVLY